MKYYTEKIEQRPADSDWVTEVVSLIDSAKLENVLRLDPGPRGQIKMVSKEAHFLPFDHRKVVHDEHHFHGWQILTAVGAQDSGVALRLAEVLGSPSTYVDPRHGPRSDKGHLGIQCVSQSNEVLDFVISSQRIHIYFLDTHSLLGLRREEYPDICKLIEDYLPRWAHGVSRDLSSQIVEGLSKDQISEIAGNPHHDYGSAWAYRFHSQFEYIFITFGDDGRASSIYRGDAG